MSNVKQLKIEGVTYSINKWPTSSQIRKLSKIGKTLAVPFFQVGMKAAISEEELANALPEALYMLFQQLEDEDSIEFFSDCLEGVWLSDREASIDDFEDFDDLLQVVAEVLVLNFGKTLEGKGFMAFQKVARKVNQTLA